MIFKAKNAHDLEFTERWRRSNKENIHTLVESSGHEQQEPNQDLKCQVCRKKFTSHRNTI